jgi:hypothetical protein
LIRARSARQESFKPRRVTGHIVHPFLRPLCHQRRRLVGHPHSRRRDVLSSTLTHGGLLKPLASPALGLLRPTFPAMRLATRLSSLQCTPLQPSSHLFHYEITLPLSTVRRPNTNTADRTPGGACHCPVMAHAQLYFSNGARVIVSASCPCSSTPLSSDQAPYVRPP